MIAIEKESIESPIVTKRDVLPAEQSEELLLNFANGDGEIGKPLFVRAGFIYPGMLGDIGEQICQLLPPNLRQRGNKKFQLLGGKLLDSSSVDGLSVRAREIQGKLRAAWSEHLEDLGLKFEDLRNDPKENLRKILTDPRAFKSAAILLSLIAGISVRGGMKVSDEQLAIVLAIAAVMGTLPSNLPTEGEGGRSKKEQQEEPRVDPGIRSATLPGSKSEPDISKQKKKKEMKGKKMVKKAKHEAKNVKFETRKAMAIGVGAVIVLGSCFAVTTAGMILSKGIIPTPAPEVPIYQPLQEQLYDTYQTEGVDGNYLDWEIAKGVMKDCGVRCFFPNPVGFPEWDQVLLGENIVRDYAYYYDQLDEMRMLLGVETNEEVASDEARETLKSWYQSPQKFIDLLKEKQKDGSLREILIKLKRLFTPENTGIGMTEKEYIDFWQFAWDADQAERREEINDYISATLRYNHEYLAGEAEWNPFILNRDSLQALAYQGVNWWSQTERSSWVRTLFVMSEDELPEEKISEMQKNPNSALQFMRDNIEKIRTVLQEKGISGYTAEDVISIYEQAYILRQKTLLPDDLFEILEQRGMQVPTPDDEETLIIDSSEFIAKMGEVVSSYHEAPLVVLEDKNVIIYSDGVIKVKSGADKSVRTAYGFGFKG